MEVPPGLEPGSLSFAGKASIQLKYGTMEKQMKELGKFWKKVDDFCGAMNVILTVLAIGLGMLCVTIWLSNQIIRDVRRAQAYNTAHPSKQRVIQQSDWTAGAPIAPY